MSGLAMINNLHYELNQVIIFLLQVIEVIKMKAPKQKDEFKKHSDEQIMPFGINFVLVSESQDACSTSMADPDTSTYRKDTEDNDT
jgi:hypothetical protein